LKSKQNVNLKMKNMKRTIVFTAMALLISAGVMAQSANQVRTQTRTEAQTQVQTQTQTQNQVQTQAQDPVMTQTRQQTRLQIQDGSQARVQDQARINRQARIHQNAASPNCPNQGQAIRSAAMQRNAMKMSRGAGAGRR
jgi:hypothetical protein